jgi:AraC family transcriptional regulator of arabinose operon
VRALAVLYAIDEEITGPLKRTLQEMQMLSVGMLDQPLTHRFARGPELPFWTLGYLLSGQVLAQTPHGQQMRLAPTITLTPPHNPYAIQWGGGEGKWTEIWAIFDPPAHWTNLLQWPPALGSIGELRLDTAPRRDTVTAALLEALDHHRSGRPNARPLALNALERVLLMLDEINPLRGRQRRDPRVIDALDHITRHFQHPMSVESLADRACLSPSRFAHLFRTQMGMGPMQYVEKYRLDRAAERLLSNNDSIEQIARATGFDNPFHFSTRFRRRFAKPPSRYRLNPAG